MAIETLPLQQYISEDQSSTYKYRILNAEFGDGYSQTAPDGINNEIREVTVMYKNLLPTEYNIVMNFLRGLRGAIGAQGTTGAQGIQGVQGTSFSDASLALYVKKAGDTMTGALTVNASLNIDGRDLYTALGTGNIRLGVGSIVNNSVVGDYNIGIGYKALYGINVSTAMNNVAIGHSAGHYYSTGGSFLRNASDCIFIGELCRAAAITTNNEIVIGAYALGKGSNTVTLGNTSITKTYLRGPIYYNGTYGIGFDASLNTFFGDSVLVATSGIRNTGFGYRSLAGNTTGSYNTGYGYATLAGNTTGSYNTGYGYATIYSLTSGGENTALGYQAGRYYGSGTDALTTSSKSIFIGSNVKASANNATNEIVIGYNAVGNGSNTVTLGNDSITATYLKGAVISNASIGYKTSAYTATINDCNGIIEASGTFNVTLPNNMPVGYQTTIVNMGPGIITLNASTLYATDSSVALKNRYAGASAYHKGSGVWVAFGNLK